MSPTDFDRLIDRRDTASQKWEKYRDQEILPMWVADTDFMAPPSVLAALHERVDHGVFGYTNTPATLNERVCERLQRRYDWTVSSDQLVWLPGLVCGLHLACRAATEPGATVMTPQPIYPPFMSAPRLSEREMLTLPMVRDNGRLRIDFDALEQAITPATRLLLFCNPHNPGGTVYRREELEQLGQIVLRHDLLVCSDEVHCDLILEPGLEHIPLASLSEELAARTITLMAPSKTYNIAGLGCAFAVIPDAQLRRQFQRVRKGIVPDVNLLGYTAAEAAYADGDAWNEAQLNYLRGNRDYLVEQINALPGLKLDPIEATYLAWIDVSGAKLENPAHFFEQAGVGLSPGRDFGDDRFMRLNFGCPRAWVEEAVDRIRRGLLNSLPA
ncbi:MalY/PatB family protein [Marinobacterium sp. YM272]|uniref:MalY/PatB family protein n=1 Tax=Marinobacterium sp. YM272 TaxID=3421654 RepID=UPI003D7F8798